MGGFAKLKITGTVRVDTGLHIGASSAFSAIGAIDSPVVKDTLTRRPIIPGSSLKGKMRTLLARSRSQSVVLPKADRDEPEILRLFGGSAQVAVDGDGSRKRLPNSRLKFADCFMSNYDALRDRDIPVTEVKFENTINRLTAVANPRQIERVIRGAEFALELIYDVDDEDTVAEDFHLIREGLTLIENDYLGGHGSRGSGRISFVGLAVEVAYGEVEDALLAKLGEILQK
jgi:CRISPR-associated protein Csm3